MIWLETIHQAQIGDQGQVVRGETGQRCVRYLDMIDRDVAIDEDVIDSGDGQPPEKRALWPLSRLPVFHVP